MNSGRLRIGSRGALGLVTGLCLGLLVTWQLVLARAGAPTSRLGDNWHRQASILDRHGQPLRTLPSVGGLRGAPISLEAMGTRLVTATLLSEDRRFYEHSGVDYQAIVRAFGQNLKGARIVSGASTISQQLVKLLDSEGQPGARNLWRKLEETARAQNLERELSKAEILAAYINRLNYGQGLVGPASAASVMFHKAPAELSWAEASLLAVLPRAPSQLNPYTHPERARKRQRALLEALHTHGVLARHELERALETELYFEPARYPFEAPHWVDRLGREAKIPEAGELLTTLDLGLQQDAQTILQSHEQRLKQRGADNAALVVVDNQTGEVLAYVGSLDYDSGSAGQVDHADAPRQAGSTLKPFVYALGFERGLGAHELLPDVSTRFGSAGVDYVPDNFDHVFHGPVSARVALGSSLNVPAVRIAASLPEGALLGLLKQAGMTSLDKPSEHYGLSLALGSGEVTLRELVAGYAMLARKGREVTLKEVVANPAQLGKPVRGPALVRAEAAQLVTESLADPLARVLGLGGRGPYRFAYDVAVKTGTSSGYRDAWTLGYTRERTVGVWVGNSSGAPTAELTGAAGAGPIFADLMGRAMRDVERRHALVGGSGHAGGHELGDSDELVEVLVCPLSGLPVSQACPDSVKRRVGKRELEAQRGHSCPLHRHASRSSGGTLRCSARGPERIVVLGDTYAAWLGAQPPGAPGRDPEGLPWLLASGVAGCTEPDAPEVAISSPSAGAVFLAAAEREVSVPASAELHGHLHDPNPELEFVVDGKLEARARHPYRVDLKLERGDHELLVRPKNTLENVRLARVSVSVR